MIWQALPICENCWIHQEGEWESLADGNEQLVAVRMPVRIVTDETVIERCYSCSGPTISGIYVRRDVT